MAELWPWLAVAGLGALHGLSPANGGMFAAACGVRMGDAAQARRALLPIGIGHLASVALVAYAFAQGVAMDRPLAQGVAGALLVGAAAYRLLSAATKRRVASTPAAHTGIALWSFLMSTAHGAGLMLVPALVPLCLADGPARTITATGSLVLALGAVTVHMAAMLVTTGVIATRVCRGVAALERRLRETTLRRTWIAALAATGAPLMVLR